MKNYYQILAVSETASQEEIKKAYRKLARQYHPDVAKTKQAEKKFKEINKAYENLSDPLKRADYDQFIHQETFVKTEGPRTKKREVTVEKTMIMAAFVRVAVFTLVCSAIGFILELIAWWWAFSDQAVFSFTRGIPGSVAGFLIGLFWAADANFKVESFLGQGAIGRIYTFLRTICMGLASGYMLGLLGALLDHYFYGSLNWITFVVVILGTILGATAGSDGDTIEKIYSSQGRFNLLYTALRGIEIGVIIAIVGSLLGLLMTRLGAPITFVAWAAFGGFILGDIAGSIAPPNLAAYASYASAYVKNIIVIIIVIVALLIGMIIGSFFYHI